MEIDCYRALPLCAACLLPSFGLCLDQILQLVTQLVYRRIAQFLLPLCRDRLVPLRRRCPFVRLSVR